MGCVAAKDKGKKKQPVSKPASPKASVPVHAPVPVPSVLPVFRIILRDEQLHAVLTSTNLALTVSQRMQTVHDCKSAGSEVLLLPERFFYYVPSCKVAFFAVDVTHENVLKLECKMLTEGSIVELGEAASLPVLKATCQRIYYDSGPNILPGTPIYSDAKLVGLHEKPGKGINLVWIYSELLAQGMSLPEDLSRFLKTVQGEGAVTASSPQARLYNVLNGTLISYNIDSDEFLDHTSGLPPDVKFCTIPQGLFMCGGLVNKQATTAVHIFEAAAGCLLPDRTPMSKARAGHSLCYFQGSVYCMSGKSDILIPDCERYSRTQDTWQPLPSFPVPRLHAGSCPFNKQVYVVGGIDSANAPIQSVLRLHQDTWETLITSLPGFTQPVLVESTQTCVYVFNQGLVRWQPDSGEHALIVTAEFRAGSIRVRGDSLYVFTGQSVQEAKLTAEPVTWLLHNNSIPNFI